MKLISGVVTATKMNKTATVSVTRFVAHPLYRKRMRKTKKYQVHDEVGHKIGDNVNFVACAPISKTKKWKIVENVNAVAAMPEVKAKQVLKKAAPAKKVSVKKRNAAKKK